MNTTLFIVVVIVIAGLVLTSLVVEAMRAEPDKPAVLSWAPDLPIQYTLVDGIRLRYVKTGDGPPLVLLHTLRTHLAPRRREAELRRHDGVGRVVDAGEHL